MTPAGFAEWARFHKSLICVHHDQYSDMLATMEPIFLRMKATVEELDNASLWLWEHPDQLARSWGEHGGLLRLHIMRARGQKERDAQRQQRASEGRSTVSFSEMLAKIGKPKEETA